MWIIVEDGNVFEGNEDHWADCFFSNVTEKGIRDWCKFHGYKVEIMDCQGHTCQTILAQRMAKNFYDIPIAVTVLDDKVYGAYIGNWKPYDLPAYQPMVATLAIQMGLFNDQTPGEIDGKPVTWWRNVRVYEGAETNASSNLS